jgi:23S rRNA pseudouridine2605 synthase
MNRDDVEGKDPNSSDQPKPSKRPRIKKPSEPESNPYSDRPLYRSDREDNRPPVRETNREPWGGREQSDRPVRPFSPERRSYGDSGERPRRTDWSDRNDRGNRSDRSNESDRGNRSDYGNRSDRGERNANTDRPSRPSWSDHGNRDDREDRGNQSDRPYTSWGERAERNERSERPDRPNRGSWGNRPNRSDSGNRTDRGDRPYRPREDSGQRGGFGRPNSRPGGSSQRSGGSQFRSKFQKGPNRPGFRRPDHNNNSHIRPEYPASFDQMPEGPIRLNRYIASTGLCSRREADEFIKNGQITVNGILITELGSKVNFGDEVIYNGTKLESEKKVYILLNKPKDYVTTVEDPNAQRTVMELVKEACKERIYPVGRLDRMTTGVLLLTNDGELTRKLTHPENEMKKIYHLKLDKELNATDFQTIMTGITLDDGYIRSDSLDFTHENDFMHVGIEIHSGRNRIVRRIFEHLGYKVQRLDRVFFAGLTKKGLKRGEWRYLLPKEVSYLKMSR